MADPKMHFREILAQKRFEPEGRANSTSPAQPKAPQTAPAIRELASQKCEEEEEGQTIPSQLKLPTPPNTFRLFPRLPAELQALIFSHAVGPDQLAHRETMNTTPFLSAKLEDFTDYESEIQNECDGSDGKLDPLRPYLLLLSPHHNLRLDSRRQKHIIRLHFRTRTNLSSTSQMARRSALEAWKNDLEDLCGSFGTSFSAIQKQCLVEERFLSIVDELLTDVRGTLGGNPSQLPKLWERRKRCKQTELKARVECLLNIDYLRSHPDSSLD